jgi:hypothetical protein
MMSASPTADTVTAAAKAVAANIIRVKPSINFLILFSECIFLSDYKRIRFLQGTNNKRAGLNPPGKVFRTFS